jgi:hypothetical protein
MPAAYPNLGHRLGPIVRETYPSPGEKFKFYEVSPAGYSVIKPNGISK